VHLLVVAGSDRGLAGGFNATILREARRTIRQLQAEGKEVKLLTIGRKPRDSLRRDHSRLVVETLTDLGRPRLTFATAQDIGQRLTRRFEAGEFDQATIVYNRFRSAMTQVVTRQPLIPFTAPPQDNPAQAAGAIYEFEPDEEDILKELLPRALAIQLYGALLENAASEQGARMTAMDNATRNAGEMINKLNMTYNRTRQASITKELIEIISGAEAL
jgi:F-type H+-transporting ATPase subunit gamma